MMCKVSPKRERSSKGPLGINILARENKNHLLANAGRTDETK